MYNFSGIYFRIWGVCSFIFLFGIILILLERPWKKGAIFQDFILGIIAVAVSICLSCVYLHQIYNPDVLSYTGKYISSSRDSTAAPPLPVTFEYIFGDGIGKNKSFYLDTYSKKEIYPENFKYNHQYTIYYDDFTNVILRVED